MLKFYNTLSKEKELFTPISDKKVGMYNCGPTVYNFAHLGNLRAYVFADLLKRTLESEGYSVKQVINITDVGHLVGDSDEGRDKVEESARKEKKTAKEITEFYTNEFLKDIKSLNIDTKDIIFPRATKHIKEQIELIQKLDDEGYIYKTSDGMYFDTARFKNYGKLGNIDIEGLKEGARIKINTEKRNMTDFALWKFSQPNEKRQQEWESPWGIGFPGWHIECSAMSMKYLGETFDVHTGGIDHIPVHHNNEIAQSEGATGKEYARYWMHNAFVNVEGGKMAKSDGNFARLQTVIDKGIDPIAYRYWLLTSHYRTPVNFTWESLSASEKALNKLRKAFNEMPDGGVFSKQYLEDFKKLINDDIDTPKALALAWQLIKDKEVSPADKKVTLENFDKILGLNIGEKIKSEELDIPKEIIEIAEARETARKEQDWKKSDEMRGKLADAGWEVSDEKDGYKLLRKFR